MYQTKDEQTVQKKEQGNVLKKISHININKTLETYSGLSLSPSVDNLSKKEYKSRIDKNFDKLHVAATSFYATFMTGLYVLTYFNVDLASATISQKFYICVSISVLYFTLSAIRGLTQYYSDANWLAYIYRYQNKEYGGFLNKYVFYFREFKSQFYTNCFIFDKTKEAANQLEIADEKIAKMDIKIYASHLSIFCRAIIETSFYLFNNNLLIFLLAVTLSNEYFLFIESSGNFITLVFLFFVYIVGLFRTRNKSSFAQQANEFWLEHKI